MTRRLALASMLLFPVVVAAAAARLGAEEPGQVGECNRPPSEIPGFRAVVSARFLTSDAARLFRRCYPLYEQVEEGSISSTINVAARAYLVPNPCPDRIALQFVLHANAIASSVRSQEKVHAFTREYSTIWVNQEFFLDGQGFAGGGLAVSSPIRSRLLKITTEYSSPLDDIIQGFGEARFDAGQERDDRKITAAAERRLYRNAAQEAGRLFKDANKQYQERFLDELARNGLNVRELRFSSDSNAVQLGIVLKDQVLPSSAPALPAQPIGLQLHPDLFNTLANRSLAGKTYTDKELDKSFTDLGRYLDLPPLAKTEDLPWSVTLTKRDPLTLKVDGDQIEMRLRGETYTSGDNRYTGMNVTVRYRIVRKEGEIKLIRDEELEVLPPDFEPGKPLGARQAVLRSLLRRRFGRLLPREIPFRDLALPEALSFPGTFRIVEFQTDKGWLTVGLGYKQGSK
jgi:hypothetical protein